MKFFNWFSPKIVGLALLGLIVSHPVPGAAQNAGQSKVRPAIYEFGATYCVSCKEMAQIMKEITERYGDQLEVRMVYVDQGKDLFQQYKIMLIPTQVFLDAAGKEVDRHIGALPREEVIKRLKELKFIR